MKIKKQYLIGLALLIIFIISLSFLFVNRKKEIPIIVPVDKNYSQERIEPIKEIQIKGKDKKESLPVLGYSENIKIELEVSDKKYETEVKEGSSVFEAMEKIKNDSVMDNSFDFKYKETPGLGNFITEINGMKGAPGKYWIYYINNEKATIGASKFILKQGDIIRWNQEGL